MLETQKLTLDKAIKSLGALEKNTDVRWSISVGGETYGNAELTVPKLSSRNYKYKRGETRAYFQPFIDGMEVGDAVNIPFGSYDPAILTSNIGTLCWKQWGSGSYTIARLDTKGVVQLMRLA